MTALIYVAELQAYCSIALVTCQDIVHITFNLYSNTVYTHLPYLCFMFYLYPFFVF